ncbi:MAG: hypothetical protein K5876_03305 [Ruminiclostridium sp.]|nr:hypothetical protein [Ruminiclostridium sp.]
MTDYAMKYDKKTMSEYITHSMTCGAGGIILPMICAALLIAIPVSSLIMYFISQIGAMLITALCAAVMDLAVAGLLFFTIRTYSNKMLAAYAAFDGLVCSVSSEKIIIVQNGVPRSVTDWNKINDIYEGKRAFFLKTDSDMLIILQKDNVLSGTVQETSEIIAEKRSRSK